MIIKFRVLYHNALIIPHSCLYVMKRNANMKFGSKFHLASGIFVFAVGLATIILGVNEATIDALDNIGSNYWFAWCAVISGIATLPLILRWLSSLCR
jgi:hypothetical protein